MRKLLAALLFLANTALADESINLGIDLTIPSPGQTNWGTLFQDEFAEPISAHDHTGSGKGLQIGSAALTANAVTGTSFRLNNNQALRARNVGNSADIDLIKINTSDKVAFGATIAAGTFDAATITSVDINGGTAAGLLFDGNLTFSGTRTVLANTLNGADSAGFGLGAGGALDPARGAYIALYGNEAGEDGRLDLVAGDDTAGLIRFHTGSTLLRAYVDRNGDLTFDSTNGGGVNDRTNATVTAAGADQAGATALAARYSRVTTATSNQGVRLPATVTIGGRWIVNNRSGNPIRVYPGTGAQIDEGGANIHFSVQDNELLEVIGTDSDEWDIVSYQ